MVIDTSKLATSLTSSWKTSLAGIASLALAAYNAYTGTGGLSGAIHDPKVQTFFILGVLGLFAKDYNTTGGSKPATPEAAARVAEDTPPKEITHVH